MNVEMQLRVGKELAEFFKSIAEDSGVSVDDVASVMTNLALRRYLPSIEVEPKAPDHA